MASRSLAGLVLDEAAEVLGELGTWLRLAHACPKCAARQGCSHLGRCPLRRVARLRCLLGSGDPQRRGEALVALRRERAELATSAGDRRLPASTASEMTLTSSVIEVLRAMSVPLEPGALTVLGETTVPTLATATPPTAHVPPRRMLKLLRKFLRRLCAAHPRRRGARRAHPSRMQRGGSALVLGSTQRRAVRDNERRARRETRGMDPVPPLWRLVLLLLPQAREGHLWPSRGKVERAMRLHRRAVIRLFRALDQRAVLSTRPRSVLAGKAGAP
jgi:hypothetical protein